MIEGFNIQIDGYKYEGDLGESDRLSNLKKCNIFVGPNNSGKSRFIRSVLNVGFENQKPLTLKTEEIDKSFALLLEYAESGKCSNGIIANFIKGKFTEENKTKSFESVDFFLKLIEELTAETESAKEVGKRTSRMGGECSGREDQVIQRFFVEPILSKIPTSYSYFNECTKGYKKIYVPMLRGLRPIHKNPQASEYSHKSPFTDADLYRERTIYDYFSGDEKKNFENFVNEFKGTGIEIFTGLNVYDEITRMLLGSQSQRKLISDFETFLSKNFFNTHVTLTPNIDDDVLYISLDGEEDKPIYDLGDGLQNIIISTFVLFKYSDSCKILVLEEPEMTMHPGMQRKLIEVLLSAKEAEGVQLFITTHSNHFLDLTYDYSEEVSIYSVEKKKENEFLVRDLSRNKEILEIMGIRNSSVFLANCVIWVEGISDWLLLKPIMKLHSKTGDIKTYEEDKHFAYAEYGGGNVTHYGFAEGNPAESLSIEPISKHNFIIADADNTTPSGKDAKSQFRSQMKEVLGDKNFWTEHKEIENLIPGKVWQEYFKKHMKGVKNYKFVEGKYKPEKFETDLKEKRILAVLKTHFIEVSEKASDSFKADFSKGNQGVGIITPSGGKTEMAKRMVKIMEKMIQSGDLTYDDFPEQTKTLVSRLSEFIESNN